jgi:hypothetical protein
VILVCTDRITIPASSFKKEKEKYLVSRMQKLEKKIVK